MIALHREGPIKGAQLCSEVIKGAIEAAQRARSGTKRKKIQPLSEALIVRIEQAYELQPGEEPGTYAYLKPQEDVLDKAKVQRW